MLIHSRFQSKSISLKANVIRTSLIPFLNRHHLHASCKNLRPEDLDRRVNILNKWWIGLCRADMMPRSVGMFTLVWFFRRLMLLHSVSRAGYGTVLVTCTRREAPNERGAALSFPSSMQHLEGEPEDQWRRCDIGATSHRRGHTRGVQLSVWPDKS